MNILPFVSVLFGSGSIPNSSQDYPLPTWYDVKFFRYRDNQINRDKRDNTDVWDIMCKCEQCESNQTRQIGQEEFEMVSPPPIPSAL